MPTTPCIARILDEPIELGGYHLDSGVRISQHYSRAYPSEQKYFNIVPFPDSGVIAYVDSRNKQREFQRRVQMHAGKMVETHAASLAPVGGSFRGW